MEELPGSPGTEQQDEGVGQPPIDVDDEVGLINALKPHNAGRTILVKPGRYIVGVPLTVPNRATLQGAGVMQFDAQGRLPVKFDPHIRTTTITASSDFKGNLVTLGHQSLLRTLILEGANQIGLDAEGRGGNVVAVASRRPGDAVSATIEECELINKLKSAGGPGTDGPTGGAILAYTRNPERDAAPAPHEDAEVTLALTRSIVRAPKGMAVFAMNFASSGRVTVDLTRNEIGGPLDVIGGLSRPDRVHSAKTTIKSHGNHYSPQGESDLKAWQIVGGSSSPFGGNASTDSNSASVQSNDDQIEDFQVGIEAIGGRRLPAGGSCSHNEVMLELVNMTLVTKPPGTAKDFVFEGARSFGPIPAGENNAVVVEVLAGTTPKRLFHIDIHDAGFGTGNQLVFKGTLAAFTQQTP